MPPSIKSWLKQEWLHGCPPFFVSLMGVHILLKVGTISEGTPNARASRQLWFHGGGKRISRTNRSNRHRLGCSGPITGLPDKWFRLPACSGTAVIGHHRLYSPEFPFWETTAGSPLPPSRFPKTRIWGACQFMSARCRNAKKLWIRFYPLLSSGTEPVASGRYVEKLHIRSDQFGIQSHSCSA